MAIAATAVWEVRTTGSDNNGGFYTSGGTDYSQQDSAQLIVDGATYTATVSGSTITTDAPLTSALIGNGCNVLSGTGVTQGFYEITGINTGAGTITLDRSTSGSGVATTFRVGGAVATPGKISGVATAGNTVHVKSGTYSITSTTANIAGGRLNITNRSLWIGYGSARNDGGTKPKLQASGISSVTLVTLPNQAEFNNFEVDGASLSSIDGFGGGVATARGCKVTSCRFGYASSNVYCHNCSAHSCQYGFTGPIVAAFCYAKSCTTAGFQNGNAFISCIADACQVGFLNSGSFYSGYFNCVAYGSTSHGFNFSSNQRIEAENCISYGNGGWGFNSSLGYYTLRNCAGGSNTSGNVASALVLNYSFTSLSSNPFTNASSGDFSLNSTSGGGLGLKSTSASAVGYPTLFPGGISTSNYADIGAVQSAPASGGVSAGRTFNAV